MYIICVFMCGMHGVCAVYAYDICGIYLMCVYSVGRVLYYECIMYICILCIFACSMCVVYVACEYIIMYAICMYMMLC